MSVSHTGSTARAFTVGNDIAFNSGEYDPSSAEGQHVLAHELAHVRQQTGGAVSMLPKDDVQLEIDPDPELEKEAEETAQRVMAGGKLDIQRLEDTDVHVQRYPGQEKVEAAREMVSDESDDEYSVPADPEVLAQEVEGLKKRQSEMVGFLKEARPGTPVEPDWTKVALKGSYGSLIGSAIGGGVGALAGSVIPGAGTAAGGYFGAAMGSIAGGMAGDLIKKGIEYYDDREPGSSERKTQQLLEGLTRPEARGSQAGNQTSSGSTKF